MATEARQRCLAMSLHGGHQCAGSAAHLGRHYAYLVDARTLVVTDEWPAIGPFAPRPNPLLQLDAILGRTGRRRG